MNNASNSPINGCRFDNRYSLKFPAVRQWMIRHSSRTRSWRRTHLTSRPMVREIRRACNSLKGKSKNIAIVEYNVGDANRRQIIPFQISKSWAK